MITIKEFCKEKGISHLAFLSRVYRNGVRPVIQGSRGGCPSKYHKADLEKLVTIPSDAKAVKDWAEEFGINRRTLNSWIITDGVRPACVQGTVKYYSFNTVKQYMKPRNETAIILPYETPSLSDEEKIYVKTRSHSVDGFHFNRMARLFVSGKVGEICKL